MGSGVNMPLERTQTAAAVIAQWMFPFLKGCHAYRTFLSLNYKTKNNMILLLYVFIYPLICSGILISKF